MREQSFHTPEPVELEVKIPAGEIEVETVGGDESSVVLEGADKLLEQTRVELVGNRLRVELETKGPFGLQIQIGDWSFGRAGLRVVARVPHASRADLASVSADVHLRGSFASLSSKTTSGDLFVVGEVAEDVTIKTVSGDAQLGAVGGALTVQSVSGDASATSVGGDVNAKFVSGDLRLDAARAGHVTVQSISGDIAVFADVERDATIKTVSGDVRFQSSIGGDLQVQTVSGDVFATRIGGSVTTKSVSGDVRIESVREGKATLQSVSGDIHLAVERGTSLDVDAGSVSGDLSSEVPLGNDAGSLGDGPTLVVRGKTVSGDFKVFRAA